MKRDHYIYFLYDCNNIVRYVGSGRNRRYKDYSNRSLEYKDIVDKGGRPLVIVEGLTKIESIRLENKYLEHFKGNVKEGFNLINKKGARKVFEKLTYQECSEEFTLDENNFPYLRYKNTTLSGKYRSVVSTKAGELIFQKEQRPYASVQLKGRSVLIHRVIWVLFNRADLDYNLVVDHIDSNPCNNSPSNLQAITQQQNIRKANVESSTGFTGVILCERISPRYKAVWTVGNKQYTKSFGIRKYGKEQAFKLACEYRTEMQNKFYK